MASPVSQTSRTDFEWLEQAEIGGLQRRYQEIMGRSAPKWASRAFLAGNIAWALQAEAEGHPADELRDQIIASTRSQTAPRQLVLYKPGTRLIREWQGEVHEVTVTDGGYVWRDVRYRSLSRVAQAITGTKWSGPRFFGLNGRAR